MKYQLTKELSTVIRLSDNASIPTDPDNRDYSEYLTWLSEGNEPLPYVPPSVTQEQINSFRAAAYREESDPLFFKYQRDETTKEEWLAKVAEIRARFPDVIQ